MRIANSVRWLLVAATALVATTHAADATDGNAAVLASNGDSAPISVEAMAVNSPISFLTTKETTAPTPTKSTATPTTTAPVTAPTTAPATDGSTAGSHSNTVGSAITCAFRYSMPTASNLADELARLAASKKKTSGSSTPSPSTSSSTGSNTGSPTTGSSTGSGPGTDAPVATETPTTTTKAPKTKTPTTTTKAPTGSTDGATRYLQEAGEPTTAPTTVPASTTKKPVSTPTPTTKKPTTAPTTVPSPTTTKPSTSDSSSDSAPTPTPTATETPTSTSSGSGDSSATTPAPTVVTGEFTCDATFYGAWKTLDLTCGGEALDVTQAVAQSQCLIYSGVQNVVVDLKLCMSVCKFPKCANGTWDYAAEDGFTSDIYSKLNFAKFMASVGKDNLLDSTITTAVQSLKFKTDRECVYESEASFATCQCENLLISGKSSNSSTPSPAAYSPPVDKGLGDANHWADGLAKTTIDKVGIGAAAIGSSAAVVSVAAGAVMSVAGSVMGTGAGVASGVSAGASLGLAMAAVDLCQFSVMINQMNLDARPRLLQELGKRMAPATFSFLPFGKLDNSSSESGSGTSRRLADVDTTNSTDTSGMERYAELIGVKVDMLFYLTLAGVMILTIAPFVCCLLLVVVASPFVSEFRPFARKWFNKAVGALMMVLILSEYVVGVTATFQICYLIKHQKLSDVGLYLAIFALLFFAVGTILYGWYVVHSHEDELRDIGTKSHMEKPVYARYGPLYDEYKFESRYFFAPKLLLALFCGVTTGLIFMKGIWQVITLLVIHVAFLMFLEVKRPFPTPFMQKTASFVIIIKISALFLTLFLISSATSFHESLPTELRQGVGFAIIALQVVVLLCLMVRQMYIFYRTWKIKQQDDEQKETETMQRSFQPLGSSIDGMYPNNNNHHHRGNDDHHVAMLDEATPTLQYNHGYQHDTPKQFEASGARQPSQPKLRGLQPNPLPAHGRAMQRTRTVVQHDDPTPVHDYRRHGGHEIDL